MGRLDINKLVNVPTILNNLKTKLDDLNAAKSKTVPIDLRKWRDAVGIEVVKNTEFSTLNTNANNLERKFLIRLLSFIWSIQYRQTKFGEKDNRS